MNIPIIDKRNWMKCLRELDISKFPSIPTFLTDIRTTLLNKQKLGISDEVRGFAAFKKYLADTETAINKYIIKNIDWSVFDNRPPRPFQKEGVVHLLDNNKGILADDMGLGKSIQSVIASKLLPDEYNILIITLKTLKYNFAEEIGFYDDRISIIKEKKGKKKLWNPNKYTIIHFDAIKTYFEELKATPFHVIIIDEAHKLKNAKTKKMILFKEILKESADEVKRIWLLTGTPVDNRPYDYYNLLTLIKHPVVKNWRKFVVDYCGGYEDQWGRWQKDGASNLRELHEQTKGVILRRLKKDVAPELPNKERKPVWLELENQAGYDKAIQDYIDKKLDLLEDDDRAFLNESNIDVKAFTKFILWRQFCALEKINDGSLIEVISNDLEAGKKIIVFTNFTKVIDAVYDSFPNITIKMDGRTKVEDRVPLVKKFNTDPKYKLIVANLRVGSVGLNAQAASSVIVNDMDYVPSTMVQAEDRAYRIGQVNDVLAQYLLYKGTIEETMFGIVSRKMQIVSTIIEGKEENYFKEYTESFDQLDKKNLLEEIFAKIDRM